MSSTPTTSVTAGETAVEAFRDRVFITTGSGSATATTAGEVTRKADIASDEFSHDEAAFST
ncbi:MAG: hypothetical protein WCP28_10165 [Actinomycetes bacterium]